MTFIAGNVVALCYSGGHGIRRLRNVTVTKVMKTFIEIEDKSRYSPETGAQIRNSDGTPCKRPYCHIDPMVSYWDGKDARDQAIRELNTAFETLISAARNRNWDNVKTAYEALSNLVGE